MVHQPLWHAMHREEVLRELETDPLNGLTPIEAHRRLERIGANELKHETAVSPVAIFLHQFKNILIVILIVAVILSALVGELVDAAVILVIVVFCAVLGFVQEYRAERALEALKKMLAATVTVIRDAATVELESTRIVPGDILVLEAGDKLAADVRLIESHSIHCDEAALTGESVPVEKTIHALPQGTAVQDRKNLAFTGTTITFGRGRGVVVATGMLTEFGKIADQVAAIEVDKSPLEKRTDEIGKWLSLICLAICGLVVAISLGREVMVGRVDTAFVLKMLMFAIALAVAAVPEALAAIVTGALALGMHAMARQNALVKKMPAVETLGCTTVICTDKTGTLTRGEMTVRRLYAAGRSIEVSGTGYDPQGTFSDTQGRPLTVDAGLEHLLVGAVLCNNSELRRGDDGWTIKGDPTEAAFLVAAAKAGISIEQMRSAHPRLDEVPFSSERKCMTTLHRQQDGRPMAYMKGALEVVVNCCALMVEAGETVPLTSEKRAGILHSGTAMAGDALRVLGVASRHLDGAIGPDLVIETDMVFLGLIGMMDPPREEAAAAVRTCREVGIKTVMITGDHLLTAVAVARELDIYRDGDLVLTGKELEEMSEAQFADLVDKVTVYARVSPLDKLKIVKAWKARGDVVAMTGDGVNDAPALKHADIGVAMGISGTDVAKEAADMILSDDNFATIVSAIERGRWIYDNIKKYLAYLLQCNVTEVIVIGGIVLAFGPELLPLLPAAILYINLASDGLPALALGVAPPDRDIMQRPPRNPQESFFSWDILSFILRAVVIESPFFFLIFYHNLSDLTQARTMIFFLFIVVEFVIALNCRSLTYSIFQAPPHKWLLVALGWELVLVAVLVQIPAVRTVFGITVPTLPELATVSAVGLLVFILIEATKFMLRKKQGVGRSHKE
ncbi:MAG: cation-translocating P-type ATPase [Desulfobacterales bacterium]